MKQMKQLLFILLIVPAFSFAQKKSNLLLDAGAYSFNLHSSYINDQGKQYTKPIGSIVYSYAPTGKFAFGGGVEIGQLPKASISNRNQDDPTIAVFLDLREYIGKKNVFFPFFQPGYNFYNNHDSYSDAQTHISSDVTSIGQFSLGLGYSRAISAKGSGPFLALKFQDQVYKADIATQVFSEPKTTTNTNYSLIGIVATIGFRF